MTGLFFPLEMWVLGKPWGFLQQQYFGGAGEEKRKLSPKALPVLVAILLCSRILKAGEGDDLGDSRTVPRMAELLTGQGLPRQNRMGGNPR